LPRWYLRSCTCWIVSVITNTFVYLYSSLISGNDDFYKFCIIPNWQMIWITITRLNNGHISFILRVGIFLPLRNTDCVCCSRGVMFVTERASTNSNSAIFSFSIRSTISEIVVLKSRDFFMIHGERVSEWVCEKLNWYILPLPSTAVWS